VYSEEHHGTTFKIYFPWFEGEPQRAAEPGSAKRSRGGGEAVLVVEDEEMVRDLVATALADAGYDVVIASDGPEALEAAQRRPEGFDLLVTDVIMPGMNGRELSDRLLEDMPDLKVLYMSGYTQNAIGEQGVLDSNVRFLQKPFTLASLTQKVRSALTDD
jgi:CheY-like chemotaxis protein